MLTNFAMEERNDAQLENGEHDAGNLCEYKLLREEHIRQNNARMQELGVGTQYAQDLRDACKQNTSLLFCNVLATCRWDLKLLVRRSCLPWWAQFQEGQNDEKRLPVRQETNRRGNGYYPRQWHLDRNQKEQQGRWQLAESQHR